MPEALVSEVLRRALAVRQPATEFFDGGRFRSLSEARLEISRYLAFDNAERWRAALGYLAPNHFETCFHTKSQLCADHLKLGRRYIRSF